MKTRRNSVSNDWNTEYTRRCLRLQGTERQEQQRRRRWEGPELAELFPHPVRAHLLLKPGVVVQSLCTAAVPDELSGGEIVRKIAIDLA